MPLYSYKCSKCEKIVEKRLPMDERDSEQKCECGELQERTIEVPSPAIFKGEGFTPKFHR